MASQRYMVDLPTDVMCGGDFFDHMDDLLDFPNDEDGDFMGGIMETPYIQHGDGGRGTPAFPTLLSPPPRTESECDGGRGVTSPINRTDTTALDPKPKGGGDQLLDDLDIADLEWVSNFMDDSPDSLSLLNFPDAHINSEASTSPVFVLEEASSFSGGSASSTTASSSSFSYSGASSGKGPTPIHFNYSPPPPPPLDPIIISVNIPARARSKRPRPPTFSARPHVTIPFLPPPHPEPESFGESITPPAPAPAPAVYKSKKKKKNSHPPATGAGGEAVRKCMHCEIQKTPQWRAGPMGPKTLCNACGVRYKSGRLFPEYRPAASPTFVPSIHSNSHKKVVEMRINATHNGPNSCELLDCIRSGTGRG